MPPAPPVRPPRRRAPAPSAATGANRLPGLAVWPCALLCLGAACWTSTWWPLLGACAAASLVTFIAYAADKAAARRRAWRIPERTLHLLALAGGWPGALVAQRLLRHKSAKAGFEGVTWGLALLHLGAVWAVRAGVMHAARAGWLG